jgi:hypothetical protein
MANEREATMAEKMQSTGPMRWRVRELSATTRDDFDRAVIAILDDFVRMRLILLRLIDATDNGTSLENERRLMPAIIADAKLAVEQSQ